MPSFGTMFRAVVMVVVGCAAVKGWQLYGPETADVKAMACRALEAAQAALNDGEANSSGAAALAADPRFAPQAAPGAAPPVAAPQASLEPAPPLFAAESGTQPLPAAAPPLASTNASGAPLAPPAEAGSPVSADAPGAAPPLEPAATADSQASQEQQRLTVLLAKLEEMGAADPQLTPWGSSGQLYRFCCRAALANTPEHARHFEAVAEQPEAAVEQVVAKLETWRTAQTEQRSLY